MIDLVARCRELVDFVAIGPVKCLRKSELVPGEVAGAPVIAKRMRQPNAVWDWYFAREVEVYRAFAAAPVAFAPRVVALADDVLILERLPHALATSRRPYAALAPSVLGELLAIRDELAAWSFPAPVAPPPGVAAELARRLLENPSDPSWISRGLSRCAARGLIDTLTRDAALAALVGAPLAPSHGDLLLRNAMQRADGTVVLVDWECAGAHVGWWDLALLWTQLDPIGRAAIDARVLDRGRFAALVVFALCRELVFLDAFRTPPEHAGRRRVAAELEVAARTLVG